MTIQLAAPPAAEAHDPRDGAVLRGAARLAQRLLRRPAVARRQGRRHAADGELPGAAAKALAGGEDDGAPWHDAAMPIDERMQLAEGKPLPRKLFAAMAQQDCGQCGYLCETYSAAIADGQGDQAQPVRPRRQGDEPHAEAAARGDAGAAAATRTASAKARPTPVPAAAPGRYARAPGRGNLPLAPPGSTAQGSEKDTRHVVLDIAASGLSLRAGRQLRPLSRATIRRSPRRCCAALRVPPDFPDRRQDLPRGADRGLRARRRRPTRCSS